MATSGGKYVYNSARDLDSSPKGIRTEGNIIINGGSVKIEVTGRSDGSEGLESKSKIIVNDGEVFVHAYADGTQLGTFTSSGINTTVGQSNGPGGPGNRGPGHGGGGPGGGWWN